MKISMKTEYACRVLAQLAKYYGKQEWAHIEVLADAEKIPANYLVQILSDLKNGGLIHSRRGKMGGYSLARTPESITLLDVLVALEGEILGMTKEAQGESGPRVHSIWRQMAKALEQEAASVTLEDMTAGESEEMYYI